MLCVCVRVRVCAKPVAETLLTRWLDSLETALRFSTPSDHTVGEANVRPSQHGGFLVSNSV